MSNEIPQDYVDLIDGPVVVMLATLMPDNQPQVTPVWASRHNGEIWVNSAAGRQKDENMRERSQVTIAATDPDNPYRWLEVRGEVVEVTGGADAVEHIHELSQTYFGRPYSLRDGEERFIYKIRPTKVNAAG